MLVALLVLLLRPLAYRPRGGGWGSNPRGSLDHNHHHVCCELPVWDMRSPDVSRRGIEPRLTAWQAAVIPLHHRDRCRCRPHKARERIELPVCPLQGDRLTTWPTSLTPSRTRTWNLLLRRQTRYPLRQGGYYACTLPEARGSGTACPRSDAVSIAPRGLIGLSAP